MISFVWTFKAFILLQVWTITSLNANLIHGNIELPSPEVLNGLFQQLLPLFTATENGRRASDPLFRLPKATEIEKSIAAKIEELKPVLQDNDDSPEDPDKLVLEGNGERTILEIHDDVNDKHILKNLTQRFKMNVEKYKILRDKVRKKITREGITTKTKNLVMKTLDAMLAHIISNQCPAKAGPQFRSDNQNGALTDLWSQQWNNLKDQYKKSKRTNTESMEFLIKIEKFVNDIVKDVLTLSENHTISCNVIEKSKYPGRSALPLPLSLQNVITFRDKSQKNTTEKTCDQLKICSQELEEFFRSYYRNLNDTTISTLRNYAAMFLRDVNEETSTERGNIVSLINITSDLSEHKISKAFIKQVDKFNLDGPKNRTANMNALREFIKKTNDKVKKAVLKLMDRTLNKLRGKLLINIQKDITVNLDIDLGNLERDTYDRLCSDFQHCNANVTARRSFDMRSSPRKHDVYIKLQLSVDDQIKDALFGSISNQRSGSHMKFVKSTPHSHLKKISNSNINLIRSTLYPYRKGMTIVDVTRTTRGLPSKAVFMNEIRPVSVENSPVQILSI